MTTWSGRRRTIRVLAVLASLGVLLGVVGVVLPSFGDDESGDREQVTSRATDFAVAMNTFDFSNPEDYRKRIKTLLTPDYYDEFLENSKATEEVLKKNKVTLKSGDAKIIGVGVQSIDDDSADVIVAFDAAISSDKAAATAPREFRWNIAFSKTEGEWLVSRFESVGTVESKVGTGEGE
ncbi:hypothetical protein [Aeromicrobium chenweiae]|uniref:Uncharacterized protein n=1 Tax=Aeromicrobium chenweiae TaxID=2079793 RepID=A0A2S0WQ83_9ACTN|nr:hypothetical protein [Aeromicrobium chenweiae]AWB93418.1 hypothetical protein C3E78_15005 [Aeromicrobium chenweiae]TGN34410.1 hypothetical protein E4L97_05030 [Aeromicrobium chenweiae]